MGGIVENRPLSAQEIALTTWLLEHGKSGARAYLDHIARAEVVARCACGCASVDFAIGGECASLASGMEILADYQWRGSLGELFGVFVFARGGLLGGLEVWSIDGAASPTQLPQPSELTPLVISKE
jgi:hypothetical protein